MIAHRRVVALVASACLVTGCGAAAVLSAGSRVPSLGTTLAQVDSSLEHGRFAETRTRLTTLINETRTAEKNGSISAAAAARITGAARELLATLPRTGRPSTPTPLPAQQQPASTSPSSTPTNAPTPKATPTQRPPTQHPTPSPTQTASPGPTVTPTTSPTGTASPAGLISSSP